MECSAGV